MIIVLLRRLAANSDFRVGGRIEALIGSVDTVPPGEQGFHIFDHGPIQLMAHEHCIGRDPAHRPVAARMVIVDVAGQDIRQV
jgi:hypothetical protein